MERESSSGYSGSSGSKNYRSRRYDDAEHEHEHGRERQTESDNYRRRSREEERRSDSRHDRIPFEEPKKSRSTSSRSKSPNCRWEDPVKLFSEVRIERSIKRERDEYSVLTYSFYICHPILPYLIVCNLNLFHSSQVET